MITSSAFSHIMYGWASWRDRWQKVIRDQLPFEKIKEYRLFDQIYVDPAAAKQALKFTEKIVNTPSWDYRFTISMKCNGGFGIIPKVNLVSNIGIYGNIIQVIIAFFIIEHYPFLINMLSKTLLHLLSLISGIAGNGMILIT